MKKLTLQFQSKALEEKYQQYIEQVYIPKLSNFLNYVLIVIVVPCIIMDLYYSQNLGASLYILTALSIVIYKILLKKCRQFYDIYIFFMEFGTQVLMGCRIYIDGPTLDNFDVYRLFFFGASMIQIQFIMHSISQNLIFPLITTMTQLIIFITVTWNVSMYDYKFTYIIFTLLTAYFLHHNLKEKKEIFMFREQQKQWIKILKNGISQKIITIQYDQKQNELTLNVINKNATERFKIYNEKDFKVFSRRVHLFKKEIEAYEDYDKKQVNRESKIHGGSSIKNTTLESRIIQFMKQNINNSKKKDSLKSIQSQSIISKLSSDAPFKKMSQDCSQKQVSMNSIKQAEYQAIIQSEKQKPEVYKIKMSYFLNEGYHQCYIIFEQQSEEDIIKNVIDSKKKIELRFINICQQLGKFSFNHQKILINQIKYAIFHSTLSYQLINNDLVQNFPLQANQIFKLPKFLNVLLFNLLNKKVCLKNISEKPLQNQFKLFRKHLNNTQFFLIYFQFPLQQFKNNINYLLFNKIAKQCLNQFFFKNRNLQLVHAEKYTQLKLSKIIFISKLKQTKEYL
ncbi:transmembrane protein, putative (macronuclear) [Tetrahymena thermophila SB210]|uniref:Transmembrane protein, putative n=1 Tax=Tetrahymena thermophila (strain SB210) TaxID=312017 RepID=I7MEM5_TETTS|nr:transmembrane protein, putative [Tetrahymena thermophila SB210]EAR97201.2 transmembrane protein, putative [Tetrahymena thermophila SB210]|eukprot:XP_001017446.2 transmembrane protein, putative [Tetrahymena thermophila SB210]